MSETEATDVGSDVRPKADIQAYSRVDGEDSSDRTSAPSDDLVRIPEWLRWSWFGAAVLLLLAHAYETSGATFPFAPVTDALTLAFLVFAILALSVNYMSEIGLPGGGKLAFRRYEKAKAAAVESRQSAEDLRKALYQYSGQMQSWTSSLVLLPEHLDKYGRSNAERDRIVARFCAERLEEARALIQEKGDQVRLSVWWYFPELGGLVLLYSDGVADEASLEHIFKPGEGLCGQCFIEGRIYNLQDAQQSAYYQRIRDDAEYHGLLLVPIRSWTGKIRGVLSADRIAREQFGENAEHAVTALADLILIALTSPQLNGVFLDDEEV
jgi:putative methionine-R-sulfoxide reductase with GAF domain